MKNNAIMLWSKRFVFVILLLGLSAPSAAEDRIVLADFISNNEALELLAGSVDESCAICAEQKLNTAFDRLNRDLKPGTIIAASSACLLAKTESTGANELTASCYPENTGSRPRPTLTFRFHTLEEKLAGISAVDLTGSRRANEYMAHAEGLFEGTIQIVGFRYGDGGTFHYLRNAHHLQIHCKLVALKRLNQ